MGYDTSKRAIQQTVITKKKVLTCSIVGTIFILVAVAIAVINPVAMIARFNTRIEENSPVYQILQQKLDSVRLETYLFNVTNAERFMSGRDDKLKLQEYGPFVYQEQRTHDDLELDMDAGVMRYSPRTTVKFLPELSVADPRTVNITMPNIALLSVASMLSEYSYMLAQLPFNLLTRRTKSKAFVNMDANNYMWGYDEPLISVGHAAMPTWINFDKLGILDRLYDQSVKYRLEVGATDEDKFRIHKLNGEGGLQPLKYDDPTKRTKCNTLIDAYEGIAYPPGVTKDFKVRIFRNVLCRMMELDFFEEKLMDWGGQALVYKISNRTYNNNPDKQCACARDTCYNGLSDLSPCFFGLPLAVSNAHFLGGEPRLYRKLEGLEPDEEKHGSMFIIEPTTGVVLDTTFTIQVNIVLENVNFNSETAPFSDMILPIAYFKIVQPELPEEQIWALRILCFYGPRVMLGIKTVLFLVGILMLAHVFRQVFWQFVSQSTHIEFTVPEDGKPKPSPSEVPLIRTTGV